MFKTSLHDSFSLQVLGWLMINSDNWNIFIIYSYNLDLNFAMLLLVNMLVLNNLDLSWFYFMNFFMINFLNYLYLVRMLLFHLDRVKWVILVKTTLLFMMWVRLFVGWVMNLRFMFYLLISSLETVLSYLLDFSNLVVL